LGASRERRGSAQKELGIRELDELGIGDGLERGRRVGERGRETRPEMGVRVHPGDEDNLSNDGDGVDDASEGPEAEEGIGMVEGMDSDRVVSVGGDDTPSVGGELHGNDGAVDTPVLVVETAGAEAPRTDSMVDAGGEEEAVAESHPGDATVVGTLCGVSGTVGEDVRGGGVADMPVTLSSEESREDVEEGVSGEEDCPGTRDTAGAEGEIGTDVRREFEREGGERDRVRRYGGDVRSVTDRSILLTRAATLEDVFEAVSGWVW
jgi:hypothetical protein